MHPEKITWEEMSFYSDSNKTEKDTSSKYISPNVYIYVGAGVALGGKVGVMFKIVDRFTGEFSVGKVYTNFIIGSDEENMIGGGINYHKKPYLLNTSLTFTSFPSIHHNMREGRIFYSLNVGYLNINGPGVHLLGRAGLIIPIKDKRTEGKFTIGVNLDIGIGWGM